MEGKLDGSPWVRYAENQDCRYSKASGASEKMVPMEQSSGSGLPNSKGCFSVTGKVSQKYYGLFNRHKDGRETEIRRKDLFA